MRFVVGICFIGLGLVFLFFGLWNSADALAPSGTGWFGLIAGAICTSAGIGMMLPEKK